MPVREVFQRLAAEKHLIINVRKECLGRLADSGGNQGAFQSHQATQRHRSQKSTPNTLSGRHSQGQKDDRATRPLA